MDPKPMLLSTALNIKWSKLWRYHDHNASEGIQYLCRQRWAWKDGYIWQPLCVNITICSHSVAPTFATWDPWISVPHSGQLLKCKYKVFKSHRCHKLKSQISPKLNHLSYIYPGGLTGHSINLWSQLDSLLTTPQSDSWFHDPHFYRTLPSLVLNY